MDWLLSPATTGGKFGVMVVAILLFIFVMATILFIVDRPKKAPKWLVVFGFFGPAALMLIFGLVYPAIRTIYYSFFNRNGTEFIGFDNYATAFTDPDFQKVLVNTLLWLLVVPLLSTAFGLIYAVIVDRTYFEKFAKTLIFLPMAISMVGASYIWKFVYDYSPKSGILNSILVSFGFEQKHFLLDQPMNTFYLMVVMIWIQTGFAMTILSAAIKGIPDDIVEAARLDGLYGIKMFRYITIPSIRPALVVVLTTIAMGTLKVFDIVRTMTGGNYGTSVIANEFYTQTFSQGNDGLGAALAVILFVFIVPLIVYNVRQLRKTEEIR